MGAGKISNFRSQGQFLPLSVGKDTVIFPGFDGGAEWGGPAVDPETGIIYVNANDVAWTGALTPNTGDNSAQGIYLSQCGVCHGEKMMGSPPTIPSLVGVGDRLAPQADCGNDQERERKDARVSQPVRRPPFCADNVSHERRKQGTYQWRASCQRP